MKSPAVSVSPPGKSIAAFVDFPKDYRSLCGEILLPRPLRSRREYRAALAVAEVMAGHSLTRDQDDYLDAITTFVEQWEARHEPRLPDATGDEVLRQLLEANQLTGADLARLLGVSSSMASLLLSGKRQLTPAHMTVLSGKFTVSPAVFMPTGSSATG